MLMFRSGLRRLESALAGVAVPSVVEPPSLRSGATRSGNACSGNAPSGVRNLRTKTRERLGEGVEIDAALSDSYG